MRNRDRLRALTLISCRPSHTACTCRKNLPYKVRPRPPPYMRSADMDADGRNACSTSSVGPGATSEYARRCGGGGGGGGDCTPPVSNESPVRRFGTLEPRLVRGLGRSAGPRGVFIVRLSSPESLLCNAIGSFYVYLTEHKVTWRHVPGGRPSRTDLSLSVPTRRLRRRVHATSATSSATTFPCMLSQWRSGIAYP